MPQASTTPDTSRPSTQGSLSDLIAGNWPSRIFQSTGLMLAAFTFSWISFGPGVGIGSLRNFITSREPNLSIMTTSISAMKHSSDLLQFQIVREARTFLRNLETCCPRSEHLHGIDETSPSRCQFKGSETGCR